MNSESHELDWDLSDSNSESSAGDLSGIRDTGNLERETAKAMRNRLGPICIQPLRLDLPLDLNLAPLRCRIGILKSRIDDINIKLVFSKKNKSG
jgi:hypothetical protein